MAEQMNLFQNNLGHETIYHGSINRIPKPQYPFFNLNNDYGAGFYCTKDKQKAFEWAAGMGGKKTHIVNTVYNNVYDLDLAGLAILDLTKYNILYWITMLLEHRTFNIFPGSSEESGYIYLHNIYHISLEKYDVVCGYRADDSYFTFARDFLSNSISLDCLKQALLLGHLGEQIVLVSERALNNLVIKNIITTSTSAYLKRYNSNDLAARQRYRQLRESDQNIPIKNKIFLLDIMRENWSDSDERLS